MQLLLGGAFFCYLGSLPRQAFFCVLVLLGFGFLSVTQSPPPSSPLVLSTVNIGHTTAKKQDCCLRCSAVDVASQTVAVRLSATLDSFCSATPGRGAGGSGELRIGWRVWTDESINVSTLFTVGALLCCLLWWLKSRENIQPCPSKQQRWEESGPEWHTATGHDVLE